MKTTVQVFGYIVLLVVSAGLGFMGKPAEMGLAIVAGAVALAFSDIEKFIRIKGAGFEVELREQLKAVIEKETEPSESGEEGAPPSDISRIDRSTRSVINALHHPQYTWRYLGGIKKDTALQTDEVMKSLTWLVKNGFAKSSNGKSGTIWNLTKEGRHLSAVLAFTDA